MGTCAICCIIFVIFIILTGITVKTAVGETYKHAEIRGSLLYERDIDKPVIINPTYALYHRELDLREIVKATELTQVFTRDYKKFCDNVHKSIEKQADNARDTSNRKYTDRYMLLPISKLSEAPKLCQAYGGSLPEIRTFNDFRDLKNFAADNKVTNVYAGLYYDNKKKSIRYVSDGHMLTDNFKRIRYLPEN